MLTMLAWQIVVDFAALQENVVWVALYGTGWFKGIIINGKVRAVATNLYLHSGEEAQLDGQQSVGQNLTFVWSGPAANPKLSSATSANPTFTAPVVAVGTTTEIKYTLTVTAGGASGSADTMEVRIVVRGY